MLLEKERMFQHFLITRFNVPYEKWTRDKSGGITRDIKWLHHRFELFERFCFPSVSGQLNQNFQWIVFFDVDTPDEYVKMINTYKERFSLFVPCFVASMGEFFEAVKSEIKGRLSAQTSYLITSRLDNDDALHHLYIDEVQKQFRPHNDIVLNFRKGCVFDVEKRCLYAHTNESNHFLSRIESLAPSFETVMSMNHTVAKNKVDVLQLNEIRGWLTVVHNHNLVNRASGRPLFSPRKVFNEYRIIAPEDSLRVDLLGVGRYLLKNIWSKLFKR